MYFCFQSFFSRDQRIYQLIFFTLSSDFFPLKMCGLDQFSLPYPTPSFFLEGGLPHLSHRSAAAVFRPLCMCCVLAWLHSNGDTGTNGTKVTRPNPRTHTHAHTHSWPCKWQWHERWWPQNWGQHRGWRQTSLAFCWVGTTGRKQKVIFFSPVN